jgi:hypothetical protein
MHHKRRRRKNKRAGARSSKLWKLNGMNKWAKHLAKAADMRQFISGPDEDGEREVDPCHNFPVPFQRWP